MRRTKKKIVERMVSIDRADEFDLIFWQKVGPQARFSAAWMMARDYFTIKGKHGIKLRLCRSVQNIEQI